MCKREASARHKCGLIEIQSSVQRGYVFRSSWIQWLQECVAFTAVS